MRDRQTDWQTTAINALCPLYGAGRGRVINNRVAAWPHMHLLSITRSRTLYWILWITQRHRPTFNICHYVAPLNVNFSRLRQRAQIDTRSTCRVSQCGVRIGYQWNDANLFNLKLSNNTTYLIMLLSKWKYFFFIHRSSTVNATALRRNLHTDIVTSTSDQSLMINRRCAVLHPLHYYFLAQRRIHGGGAIAPPRLGPKKFHSAT